MSVTWGAFRDYVRKAIINDDPGDPAKRRWSDEQLSIYFKWAQNTLCAHTALPKIVTVSGVTGSMLDAPEDIYEAPRSLEDYGLISSRSDDAASTARPTFYNPLNHTPNAGPGARGNLFQVLPDGTIELAAALTTPSTVTIRYFAYYPTPLDENAVLAFPDWAQDPIAYLIGVHALAGYSMSAANIRMWAEAPDKGSPESNPFRAQQKWFLSVYEQTLNRVRPQNRVNYYRYER